jgi:hypothetical protein
MHQDLADLITLTGKHGGKVIAALATVMAH